MGTFKQVTFGRMSLLLSSAAALALVVGILIAQSAHAQVSILGFTLGGTTDANAQTNAQTNSQAKANGNGCLSKPSGPPPRGSWWFYRLERSTGRRCWYLGPESRRTQRAEVTERKSVTASPASTRRARGTPASPTAPPSDHQSSTERTISALRAWGAAAAGAALDRLPSETAAVAPSAPQAAPLALMAQDNGGAETSQAPQPPMRSVMPIPAATDRPIDRASEAPPSAGQLLIFLAALLAFVAIGFRTTARLWSAWLDRRGRDVRLRPDFAPTRPRVPVEYAFAPLGAPYDTEMASPQPAATVRRNPAARALHWPAAPDQAQEQPRDYAPRHVRERTPESTPESTGDRLESTRDRLKRKGNRQESTADRPDSARDRLPAHDFGLDNVASDVNAAPAAPRRRRRGLAVA
jgi:hypothetical protein